MLEIIIWDEAPIANMYASMCVSRLLKDIMANDQALGGKIIIFGGNFPCRVVPHDSRATTVKIPSNFRHFGSHLQL